MPRELVVVFPEASRRGGVERVALDLCRHEADAGRPVAFAGMTADGLDARVRRIEVRPSTRRGPLAPWAFRRAATRALGAERGITISNGVNCPPGDVAWVHSVHAAYLRSAGDVRLRGLRVPAGARRLLPQHQVLLQLERSYFTSPRPQLLLCTSQREVEDLADLYGVEPGRTRVVPNGFDPSRFGVERRVHRQQERERQGYQDGDVVLLLAANEWHRKGLGVLLEALAAAPDERLRLLLVGRKDPGDYLGLASRLGLRDRVRYDGPAEDVGRVMAACDALVLPTTYEPFGLVVVEALACGLPVAVSRLAGAAHAVERGAAGVLLQDPRDVGEISTALMLLADDDQRAAWAEAAPLAAAPYGWPHIFERVSGLVRDLG